ncbi:hypothetical protein AVEN_253333-1 [Araneus ventricosus]|uniref:Uncharacterized protein n=1 Tax=Araneus ventricosus TaxID=182803 RepID=A0A4Y2LZW4_ARAVE|nr:hypothetical protein AVEN_253333-1 [Araneus ventricosus]
MKKEMVHNEARRMKDLSLLLHLPPRTAANCYSRSKIRASVSELVLAHDHPSEMERLQWTTKVENTKKEGTTRPWSGNVSSRVARLEEQGNANLL